MTNKVQKFKVLVFTNNSSTLNYFQSLLKEPKYKVIFVESKEKVLGKIRLFLPDLIISELKTPKIDKVELCQHIRKDQRLSNTIILLITSKRAETEDTQCSGVDDYLTKPFNREHVKTKIDSYLRIKRLQDDLLQSNKELNETISTLKEHEKMLEESNMALERDKKLLRNSLREITYLTTELEKSHHHQVQLNQTLKKNFNDLVNLLASIIGLRNPYNMGHSQKVAEISRFIADKFGKTEQEIRNIEIAALLHEIGKIGISDDIMNKNPDELSEEEKMTLAQHPLVGESLLKGYSGLEKAAKIIRHIHENIDGTGYPDGLAGDAIPLGSRIIKAASQFDRMTYTAGTPGEFYRAVATLKNSVDTDFDGHVLRHLKKYVDTFADRRKGQRTEKINILDLKEGMILAGDLYTSTGIKLIPKGTKLSESSIKCILNYNKTDPLKEGISILIR